MTTRIRVDFNARTPSGLVRTGLRNVRGAADEGDFVELFDPAEAIRADGLVERVDAQRDLVFLKVDWESFAEDENPVDSVVFEGPFILTPVFESASCYAVEKAFSNLRSFGLATSRRRFELIDQWDTSGGKIVGPVSV